jgi:pyridoxal phosphate enzyme (YggS family)
VQLLAVSKTFPAEIVEEAYSFGQMLFGENRIQEATAKIPAVKAEGIQWHLVGHLQTNKIRKAVELFDVIESIDSEKVASKVNRHCAEIDCIMPVFLQVNIGEEAQKFGIEPQKVLQTVELVDELPALELRGLMAIPPYSSDPEASRPFFRRMTELLKLVNQGREKDLEELSMGMSSDFCVAIEEGSTLVRLGTAIFGPRV